MKLVIAATGASGAIYLQRLLALLAQIFQSGESASAQPIQTHEIHLVLSSHARQVIREEIDELQIPRGIIAHADNASMNVPFVSGSAKFDAMVIVPCSMGTIGRIAAGLSDSTVLRAADVFLKERRKLILVPRETPWNLIHARNVAALIEAGATILPASPSFYTRPQSVNDVIDTVVARILDHLGLENPAARRWKSET